MKKKLAYIDFWTHKKTKSGDFLRKLLSQKFQITNFWWKPNQKILINDINKFEYIFFFHVIFPYQILKKFKNKQIMWAPMYDALNFRNNFFKKIFWKQMSFLKIKILKFSKKISENIDQEKIKSLKLMYFQKPNFYKKSKKNNKFNIFFWDRGRMEINNWLKLFEKKKIKLITYFPNTDNKKKISYEYLFKKEKIPFKIIKKKFLPQKQYLSLFKKCNVFIAPRKKEGIGMSIVEAISRGLYVVGYNDSTMNEYIKNKKIGFLFDEKTKNKIKIEDVLNNTSYRMNYAEKNYRIWNENKKKIITFFLKKNLCVTKIDNYDKFLFLIDNIKFFFKRKLNINYYFSY